MDSPVPGDKTICLDFESEAHYGELLEDRARFRQHLGQALAQHPELFPPEMASGYHLHGFTPLGKLDLRLRRIKVLATGDVFQIRPSFLMPYGVERTDMVEKALYLRRYGVPFDALA